MNEIESFLVGFVCGIVFIFLIASLCYDFNSPQPIDVYRSKTTLRITYEDDIPIDSVVVLKPEFRKYE